MTQPTESQPDRSLPVPTDSNALGLRVVYMLIFAVVFWILGWTLALTAILQLVFRFANGKPDAGIARFGAALGRFAQQVIEYLTFRSDRLPFPFSEWPHAAE